MSRCGTILLFIILILTQQLHCQILNDSAKTIYGPRSCEYTYFENIKFNRPLYLHPDTTIDNFHLFNYVNRNGNNLQDLGNIGSSATTVFYEPPETIGRTSGYYTYQWYALPVNRIKLYNTKSPYTDINATFGGGYRYLLNVAFSQSIKPNWNFGANFHFFVR